MTAETPYFDRLCKMLSVFNQQEVLPPAAGDARVGDAMRGVAVGLWIAHEDPDAVEALLAELRSVAPPAPEGTTAGFDMMHALASYTVSGDIEAALTHVG